MDSIGDNILDSPVELEAESGDDEPPKLAGGSGYFPFHRGDNLIAKIHYGVYADESGILPASEWCLVTGFIATPISWYVVEAGWQAVLDFFQVPDFHAEDFFGRKAKSESESNYYRRWNDTRANEFLDALLNVSAHPGLLPIGAALHMPSFRELPYGFRKAFTGGLVRWDSQGRCRWRTSGAPSKPYFSPFSRLVVEALEAVEENAVISFIFDQQQEMEGHAISSFHDIRTKVAPYDTDPEHDYGQLGIVAYGSRLQYIGLQVADLHTHLMYCHLTREDDQPPDRKRGIDRLKATRNFVTVINADRLADMREQMPQEVQAFIEATDPPVKNKKAR